MGLNDLGVGEDVEEGAEIFLMVRRLSEIATGFLS